MALRTRTDPDPITLITPIGDDPAYARLAAQLNQLRRGLEERRDKLELYAIRSDITYGTSSEFGERKQRLREREAKLKAKHPAPKAPPAPADGLHPVVVQGLKLAAGEELPAPQDRNAHIAQLRTESAQIEEALRLVNEQIDELRLDLSVKVAESLLPQQRAILRSKLDAALALAAAVSAERELTAMMLMAGYAHLPGVLISPPLDPAARLGTTAEWDSAISTYRRALESLKVI